VRPKIALDLRAVKPLIDLVILGGLDFGDNTTWTWFGMMT
jgi:hypothetical protein